MGFHEFEQCHFLNSLMEEQILFLKWKQIYAFALNPQVIQKTAVVSDTCNYSNLINLYKGKRVHVSVIHLLIINQMVK